MQHFRCYFLCHAGKIKDVIDFHSTGDDSAVDFAQVSFDRKSGFAGYEIWQGTRRVRTQMAADSKQLALMAS
jgi:hypothetical protein